MNELKYIPGDLVKFATNTYTIVNFGENFLQSKIYALISTNSTKTAFVADRDILPIPLTPKILEKNGWKKVEYGPYGKGRIEIEQCNENEFMYCKGDLKVVFLYVHSLQHFLFGLGLNSEMEV